VNVKSLPLAIVQCYKSFGRMASYAQSPFLLLVRFYWGWQFAQTGWGKLHNLPQIATFFTSLNLPLPAFPAGFVACLELIVGILLILRLLSRFTSVVLAFNMLVTYLNSDRD